MVFPHRARDNRLKKCELSGGVEAIADQAKRTAGRHRHVTQKEPHLPVRLLRVIPLLRAERGCHSLPRHSSPAWDGITKIKAARRWRTAFILVTRTGLPACGRAGARLCLPPCRNAVCAPRHKSSETQKRRGCGNCGSAFSAPGGADPQFPRHVIHSRALRVPRERRNQNKCSPPMADCFYFGDPYGTRTHVTAVKGRCLNHLTNGPEKRHIYMCLYGSGTWIRTGDTSGMNRMLWPTELCRHMLFKQHRDSIRRHARCQQIFCVWGKFFTRISPPLRQRDTPRDRRARR